ncbi:hypothetical protein [Methanimicrococcus blatticola]|uniref:TM2 domain-containing protein n=1 Tax=Methanimicrococcus blatticola TaxID=91560 RepID=A0A484F4G5_9EURY|nr:hypothetical protein [Methanimicrococcus blatticola]MBZ3935271.1 hypothetical protein [Methanimicrococcus blatticola]MCC2508631.1 hypothetical protein [Methanimicrococcus blatticola]TDQ67936.1 hypothetical protein C7391_1490 [Methanimicrococcus blatticola]
MANSILAVILSFFIPGLGQFYCGSFLRGLMVFIATIIVSVISVALSVFIIPLLFPLLFWLWNMYDAYTLAQKT